MMELKLERKIKKAALSAALDFSMSRMNKSPERYARNIMELANCTYPGYLSKEEEQKLLNQIILMCKNKEGNAIRELINQTFPDE